jgi:acyl-CoA synthetase (AMP-forming)/AMP-acid ligase II
MGIEIRQGYGLTECGGPATMLLGADAVKHMGSAGRSFLHADIRVIRPDGTACDPGEAGEITVRARSVMRGYWNLPEATAEALRDGWLHTGDVGVLDAEGFLTIVDRLKDMIISGGENVYPAELEAVLLTVPGVREAAVIGQPSSRWGESPCAVVVRSDPSLDAATVLAQLDGRVARYKLPRSVEFVDELPRNASGKVRKPDLRQQFPGPAPE